MTARNRIEVVRPKVAYARLPPQSLSPVIQFGRSDPPHLQAPVQQGPGLVSWQESQCINDCAITIHKRDSINPGCRGHHIGFSD
jgi:hypothetical protein